MRPVTYLKQRIHAMILTLLILVIVGPTLYYRLPFFVFSPDILYVKAKVMWVLRGSIFTDPITGLVTMHPPLYHLFLAPFVAAGMDVNFVMALTAVLVVVLIFVLTYKIISDQFDRTTAFWTCLMLPFIVEYMGPRNILLATAYYFSIPFYLAGLWVYLRSPVSLRAAIAAAILWGLAFLISPVYVFLIGLTFLYEAIIRRRFKRFFIITGIFAVMLIPFYIQLYVVYSKGLGGAATFALWRGIPDVAWLRSFAVEIISPSYHTPLSLPSLLHMIILVATLIVFIRKRDIHWYIPESLLAVILTFYHFSGQYAIRIELFFSIFIVATALSGLWRNRIAKTISMAAILAITSMTVYHLQTRYVLTMYRFEAPLYAGRVVVGGKLWQNLDKYVPKDSFIFCDNSNYLRYIMPYYPVHTLGAYRSMEYFQLPKRIADKFLIADKMAEYTRSFAVIDSIATEFNITAAIISRIDIGVPLYEMLATYWKPVYSDEYFAILKKPDSDSTAAPPPDSGSMVPSIH